MKALVIGGNGFIGTNLVSQLLRENWQVRVFDRYPSRFQEPLSEVEYITGDCGNAGEVTNAVKGIDCVFHLAYTTLPHTSNEDPVYDIRSNLLDTVGLLQECRAAEINKFVFVSSGGTVYGIPQKTPIGEDHPTEPICSYGITKLSIEKYLQLFHRLYGLDCVAARISNPYGEQQNPNAKQGAISVFLGNIAAGRPISIWGDGEVIRDYIYIGDAVGGLVKCAEYKAQADAPRIFNIGQGEGHSLNQLINVMKQICDTPVEVNYSPKRPEDVPANILDISLAKKYLHWQPKVSLEEGIKRTWHWLKSLQLA